jgi:hypothetical protein
MGKAKRVEIADQECGPALLQEAGDLLTGFSPEQEKGNILSLKVLCGLFQSSKRKGELSKPCPEQGRSEAEDHPQGALQFLSPSPGVEESEIVGGPLLSLHPVNHRSRPRIPRADFPFSLIDSGHRAILF